MHSVVIVLACLHVALGGGVGDVYVDSVGYAAPAAAVGYASHAVGYAAPGAAVGYAAPAVGYAAPGAAVGYAAPAVGYAAPAAAVGYAAPAVGYAAPGAAVGYAAPAVGYAAPGAAVGYAAPAAAVGYAAPAAAVGYAAPAAAVGYAAVPTVQHVPGVADVPVTRLEAQHAVVQHEVDVAHPAVSTRKFEVRRPAIQKQFYDIEERVVIRPAGSAVVELDQPTSKLQRGPAVVTPLAAGHVSVAAHGPLAVASPGPVAVAGPAPGPVFVSSTPVPPQFDADDSLVVENAGLEAAQRIGSQLQPQVRNNGAPVEGPVPDVVPSLRSLDPHENQANQQRLIQLLTARGGVTEVGFGREGPADAPVGDAGQVRARVLSATPSPSYAAPAGERVSTRRVVVSRPIETLQEVDVLEPVTKLQRVAVETPTVVKTLRQDYARVATSVPVYGKALAPVAAHVGYY